jgi:hypothetical protein
MRIVRQRIRQSGETLDALDRISREPSPENIVALHELHARHMHELGDEEAAVRALERAERARRLSRPPEGIPPEPMDERP